MSRVIDAVRRLLPDWWTPAHTEACVLLALTFAGGFAAAVIGALADRRLNRKELPC